MSFNRAITAIQTASIQVAKNSLLSLTGFFSNKKHVNNAKSTQHSFIFDSPAKIFYAALALFANSQQTLADRIFTDRTFGIDATGTQYSFDYNANEIPELKEQLLEQCKMLISAISSRNFTHANFFYCDNEDDHTSIQILNVGIELTKNITQGVQYCIEMALQPLCQSYYDNQQNSSSMPTWKEALIVSGVIAGICLCAILGVANQNYRNGNSYNSNYRHHDDSSQGSHHTHVGVSMV